MRRPSFYRIYAWLFVLIGTSWSAASYAIVVGIDQFSVTRNGVGVFTDGFTDGAEPPGAPNFASGNPASYAVLGTIPGTAESGGASPRLRERGACSECSGSSTPERDCYSFDGHIRGPFARPQER
jgi:hypothetical protein